MAETLLGSKNNPNPKTVLRPEYIASRKRISSLDRLNASGIIAHKLISHPVIKTAKIISVYISTRYEVDTRHLIPQLLKLGKSLYAPAITDNSIILRKLTSLDDCLPGQKNILEPPPNSPVIDPGKVDVFIIPGLSFDAYLYRLGYGKGYYDSLLQHAKGYKIGIGFTNQLCFQLPHQAHDIKMDQVISDTISLKRSLLEKTSYY